MLFIKVFVLLFFILSCNNEGNIENIYVNKTQKIQVKKDWISDHTISYLWSKPDGPKNHEAKWIVNDNIMLFTPNEIGSYNIAVSIENSMGEILGKETFRYNVISKKSDFQPPNVSKKINNVNKIDKTERHQEAIVDYYTIQISSWSKLQNAQEEIDKLEKLGFEAYINQKKVNDKILYRVRIGENLSYSKVLKLKEELKKQKIQGFWIDKI